MSGSLRLSQILRGTLGDMGLYPKAQKYLVFSLWPKIVGDVSKYAKPRRIQGDVLYVATASSVWSQELHFMRESIIAQVNQALGGEQIKEVRFSEHMWDAPGDEDRAEEGFEARSDVDGTGGGEVLTSEAAAGIQDQVLSRAFRRMERAMSRRRSVLTAKGYKICPVCGCPYPKRKTACPACANRKEFQTLTRAIAILGECPETSDEELAESLGAREPYVWERARREVESRLVSFVRGRLAAEARDNAANPQRARKRTPERDLARAEVALAIRKMASLRAKLPYESMDRSALEKAVGKRYAALARKG